MLAENTGRQMKISKKSSIELDHMDCAQKIAEMKADLEIIECELQISRNKLHALGLMDLEANLDQVHNSTPLELPESDKKVMLETLNDLKEFAYVVISRNLVDETTMISLMSQIARVELLIRIVG